MKWFGWRHSARSRSLAIAPWRHVRAAGPQKVRQAGVAGGFYPADPKVLTAMIDDMLAQATPPPIHDPILAVVAPHAGYQYSGPVAAYTYAELKGRKFSRVVVIAPSHYEAFDFTSVYEGDAYATPLGKVPVDKAFARQLAKMSSTMQLSSRGHDPTSAGAEHAIEVQLPWLQRVLGDFQLVPIVMGDQSYESSRALGVALAKLIRATKGRDTLMLASSDLSHYHPYDEAEKIDHKTLNALEAWDYFSMSRNFQARDMGGLRRRAHRRRDDCRRAHGREPGPGAEVRQFRRHHRRPFARGRIQRGCFCESRKRKGSGNALLAERTEKSELLALARKSVEQAVERESSMNRAQAQARR